MLVDKIRPVRFFTHLRFVFSLVYCRIIYSMEYLFLQSSYSFSLYLSRKVLFLLPIVECLVKGDS